MDFIGLAVRQASAASPWTPLGAAAAGAVSAFGPCVAPRFLAVVGLASSGNATSRALRIGCFLLGICAGYVAIASTLSLLGRLGEWSSTIDALLALAFAIAAYRSARGEVHTCEHSAGASSARAFVMGASLSLVASPCCAPILLLIGGIGAATLSPPMVAVVALAFAVGHVLPLVCVGSWAAAAVRTAQRPAFASIAATISAGVFLGLSGYYALLV